MTEQEFLQLAVGEGLLPKETIKRRAMRQGLLAVEEASATKGHPAMKKKFSIALAAAALACLAAGGVYAAANLLAAPQAVQQLQPGSGLDTLFSAGTEINETQTVGDWSVTLLGLASGENLGGYGGAPERTYAVLAFQHTDGTPVQAADELNSVWVSPIIQGYDPVWYNIQTMSGAFSTTVAEGVAYRLIECDSVEPFADLQVDLAVVSVPGSEFLMMDRALFDAAFAVNADGTYTLNGDFDGGAALFRLPLDPAKADPTAVQAIVDLIAAPTPEDAAESGPAAAESEPTAGSAATPTELADAALEAALTASPN